MESVLLDVAGRRRSPATMPGFHAGRPPRNKGLRYPPDPPSVEEIVAVMRTVGDSKEGVRLRALVVILWRAGLRISEALALAESDLDPARGAVLVRAGKGGRRREVGMDRWGWEQLRPWLELRTALPVGALLCVLRGPTAGRPWAASSAREELSSAAVRAAACVVGLPHISSDMPTLLRWRARGSRSPSSSASSGMSISASPPCICVGLITPRSSTLCMSDERR